MRIETARQIIGTMVMSRDAGSKMIPSVPVPHGPYRLLQITKGGECILEGREEHRVPPSLIELAEGHASREADYD